MMIASSGFDGNPWADDSRTFGCLRNVLLLAERNGHCAEKGPHCIDQQPENASSVRMIEHLKNIEAHKKEVARVHLETQKRLWDRDTKDLMHIDILEERIKKVNQLSAHIQSVMGHKDQVIDLLQKPHVGDFIKIEAAYKCFVSELFPMVVPILGEMSSQLNNIEWAMRVDINDGQLDKLLSEVKESVATLQSGVLSLLRMRDSLSRLREKSFAHQTG